MPLLTEFSQYLFKTSSVSRIHVAVYDGVVAAVRHGQPVADEPHVRHARPHGPVFVLLVDCPENLHKKVIHVIIVHIVMAS